jgi:(R,R)-butanediol dehydrogenase/meso-butanediol dehydrogenase/diacetyl reductase
MLARAVEHVRQEGLVLSLGMCLQGDPVLPGVCSTKEVRLMFPHGYTFAELAETAKAFDADAFHPEMMVSDVIALEALPDVLEGLRTGTRKSLKVQVDPWLDRPA